MTLLDPDVMERSNLVGEDTYDLFASIEEAFGISFGNYEVMLGSSVLELAERVAKESTYPKADRCLSSVAFYRVRHAVQDFAGFKRSEVRPDTPLAKFLPWGKRRLVWQSLEEQLDLDLPALTVPLWLVGSSFTMAVGAAFVLSAAAKSLFGSGLSVMAVAILSFALWILLTRLLLPLGRGVPKGCETFGDLVKMVLARNYSTFASRHGNAPLDQIASLLCQLIALEVGLSPVDVTPNTRIPNDLNIE